MDMNKIRNSSSVLFVILILAGTSVALPFSIGSGDKDEYKFIVGSPGEIYVRVTWTGTANNLDLILNGPGQVSNYARQYGSCPLELRYTVTSADIKKGMTWKIGIWNFGSGTADGDISLESPGYPFALGYTSADDIEIYFDVISPGLISTRASWSGSMNDMDLSLNGPGNFGTHALGPSPLGRSYMVTNSDLSKGKMWSVSLDNHEVGQWSTASGTLHLVYPGECSWTGTWNTNFGKMVLVQSGSQVTGTYTHDQGRIVGTVFGNKLTGTWSEAPSYSPTQDAGSMQLVMSEDGSSFSGYWMYGYDKARWDGDWTGTRALGSQDLRPSGSGIFG